MAGNSTAGVGVRGTSSGAEGSGYGVWGSAVVGVFGVATPSSGVGVLGFTGESPSSGSRDMSGVSGAAGAGTGVFGGSVSGTGVEGDSGSGVGVYAYSTSNNGLKGVSGSAAGVYATSTGTGFAGSALIATNTIAGGTALYAYGISSSSAAAVITNDSPSNGDIIQGWNQAAVKFKVTTTGEVYAHGAFHPNGIDYSDRLPAAPGLDAGDVVTIGADGLLHRSTHANATDVAGVYSTKPGVVGQEDDETRTTIPVALAGVIPVKASGENGAIRAGDLLVSSSTPGRAMRAPPNPSPGSVIGKALAGLDHGTGEIAMLVMLR